MTSLGLQNNNFVARLSSLTVDPAFGQDRTYGPIKVAPSSMDDLATGSYRLLSTSENYKVLRLPLPIEWFYKAFKTDVDIMIGVLNTLATQASDAKSAEGKAGDDAAAASAVGTAAAAAVVTAVADSQKAAWIEALVTMSFDLVLCTMAAVDVQPGQAALWTAALAPRDGRTEIDEAATRAAIRTALSTSKKHAPVTTELFTKAQGQEIEMLFGPDPEALLIAVLARGIPFPRRQGLDVRTTACSVNQSSALA